jgi:hypothetical protein
MAGIMLRAVFLPADVEIFHPSPLKPGGWPRTRTIVQPWAGESGAFGKCPEQERAPDVNVPEFLGEGAIPEMTGFCRNGEH